jgi:hypothetical protein
MMLRSRTATIDGFASVAVEARSAPTPALVIQPDASLALAPLIEAGRSGPLRIPASASRAHRTTHRPKIPPPSRGGRAPKYSFPITLLLVAV